MYLEKNQTGEMEHLGHFFALIGTGEARGVGGWTILKGGVSLGICLKTLGKGVRKQKTRWFCLRRFPSCSQKILLVEMDEKTLSKTKIGKRNNP